MDKNSLQKMTVIQLKEKLDSKGLKKSGVKSELIDRLLQNRKTTSIPDNVVDKKLYIEIKNEVKSRVKRWPSAYASQQLVKEYKQKGGRYKIDKINNSLKKWRDEKWVNVCEKDSKGNYLPCGRNKSSLKNYPYCRPTIKVTDKTPRLASSFTQKQLKERCIKKKNNPLVVI